MTSKKYLVTGWHETPFEIEVEAFDSDEADEKAFYALTETLGHESITIDSVEEIESDD